MSNDFREKLFLAHLATDRPASAVYVQGQAEECCKAWGHDYESREPGMRDWLDQRVAQSFARTLGGTPIVSNLTCRRCGHEHHPAEK
jgi:hypothetical protein